MKRFQIKGKNCLQRKLKSGLKSLCYRLGLLATMFAFEMKPPVSRLLQGKLFHWPCCRGVTLLKPDFELWCPENKLTYFF